MATYPIRQLADNGGTAQFVPVTAPEAVQFPDGSNLNTFIGSVATIESNPVAANHAVGEFLCINGQVYEVIDAITAGDSISLGENVQVTNLGSQITALNNGLFTDLSYGLSEYDFPGFSIIRATPTSTQIPVTGVNVTKAPVSDCFTVVQYYNGSSNVFGTLQAVSGGKLYLLNSSGARVTGSYIEGTLVYPLPH